MENKSPRNAAVRTIGGLDHVPKAAIVGLTFGIFYIVAIVDFITGYEISCTVFYLLAISIAAWYVNAPFGVLISLLSDICTSLANVTTGEKYSSHFAVYWDAAIVLAFYLIVVWLLRSLRSIHDTLEQRVRNRTAVLSTELAERKRLEKEILVIAEREQQRIGRDIHDSLCQHLTGTALAEQFLLEKLSTKGAPEAEDAGRVVSLIEDAISMARGLAAGLSPIDTGGEALLTALSDLAEHFSTQFKVDCHFECDAPVIIHDASVTTHLYRIAQEAVHNAIRHGKAGAIYISLSKTGTKITLCITDNGIGLPAGAPSGLGMGLRNMKYRASIIGGTVSLASGPIGTRLNGGSTGQSGARVTCTFSEGAALPN